MTTQRAPPQIFWRAWRASDQLGVARVLVTDSDNRSALAAVRALGRSGHQVFVAAERHPSLASVSRYAAGVEICPAPSTDPAAFTDAIVAASQRLHVDVVVPMTEITTLLLAREQERLPPGVRLPFPDAATVASANDKAHVLRLAAELGIPIPRTEFCESPAHAPSLAAASGYPVVVKAARSRVWSEERWLSTTVRYAFDAAALAAHIAQAHPLTFPLLLQERIEGPGVGVFVCLDERQQLLASFAHRRLREKPPSGGVSVLCESTRVDPAALDYAMRLLTSLRWRGVAMVEFKRDLRDGSLRLMEINGRFWGSLQLAIDAGVDFPSLLIDAVMGHPRTAPEYRTGVQTRWLWGDVDSLLSVLFKSRQQLNLPASHPGRIRTLLAFLKLWSPRMRFELERSDDLRPWLLETRRWLSGRR